MEGMKHDQGKIDYSLLPKGVIEELGKVMTFGAQKYAPDTWQQIENAKKRYFAAAFRHLNTWFDGEQNDPESGLMHLSHALTNIAFLIWFEKKEVKEEK
jgi:hypothetical protein